MKKILLLAILFLPFLGLAQRGQDFSREVREFSKIKASNGVKVNLIKGIPGTITIRSRGIEQGDIITEVVGKTLKLSVDVWSQLRENHRNWSVEMDVPVQTLAGITCVTGATVNTEFILSGQDMVINTNTGGELYLDLSFDEIEANATTGAILKLKGKTNYLEITSSVGAEVEADQLIANYVQAHAGIGGTLEVYAKKEINSSASLGGEIEVRGRPARFHTRRSLGGVISGHN